MPEDLTTSYVISLQVEIQDTLTERILQFPSLLSYQFSVQS